MYSNSDALRFTSAATIVFILAENGIIFFKNWKIYSNSLSISLNIPFRVVAFVLLVLHALQVACCASICVSTKSKLQTHATYILLSCLLFCELLLRVSSNDDAAATKCTFLLVACANILLDSLSSTEQRVYSGFVGEVKSNQIAFVDTVVGRFREAATRYRVASLSQVTCVAVLLYTLITAESILNGAELRRQLGHASWSKSVSLISMLSSFAVFDRSYRSRKKHL